MPNNMLPSVPTQPQTPATCQLLTGISICLSDPQHCLTCGPFWDFNYRVWMSAQNDYHRDSHKMAAMGRFGLCKMLGRS